MPRRPFLSVTTSRLPAPTDQWPSYRTIRLVAAGLMPARWPSLLPTRLPPGACPGVTPCRAHRAPARPAPCGCRSRCCADSPSMRLRRKSRGSRELTRLTRTPLAAPFGSGVPTRSRRPLAASFSFPVQAPRNQSTRLCCVWRSPLMLVLARFEWPATQWTPTVSSTAGTPLAADRFSCLIECLLQLPPPPQTDRNRCLYQFVSPWHPFPDTSAPQWQPSNIY